MSFDSLPVRCLKPVATLDWTVATAANPATKCADGKVITGFDAPGAPICTAITTVYSADEPYHAVPRTTRLRQPTRTTSNRSGHQRRCVAPACSPTNGRIPSARSLPVCANGNCPNNVNSAFVNCDTTNSGKFGVSATCMSAEAWRQNACARLVSGMVLEL